VEALALLVAFAIIGLGLFFGFLAQVISHVNAENRGTNNGTVRITINVSSDDRAISVRSERVSDNDYRIVPRAGLERRYDMGSRPASLRGYPEEDDFRTQIDTSYSGHYEIDPPKPRWRSIEQ
jgi:hypothetical protein